MTNNQAARRGQSPLEVLGRRPADRIHRLEKTVVGIVAIHLALMPWALGTMWWQTQLASLALSVVSFVVSLCPRVDPSGQGESTLDRSPQSKLIRFPIFWLGLALVTYIAIQGFNPNWRYGANNYYWWLAKIASVPRIPHSVAAPFVKFNVWRQEIIYGDAWLLVCSLWVGISRRKSLRVLLGVLAANGAVLGIVLIVQYAVGYFSVPWAPVFWARRGLAGTFIYKNHAAAYFALMVFVALGLAVWTLEFGIRALKRSTPAAIWAAIALTTMAAVIMTLSRGATLILGCNLVLFLFWFIIWQRKLPEPSEGDSKVRALLALLALVVTAIAAKSIDFSAVYSHFALLTDSQNSDYKLSVDGRLLVRTAALRMLRETGLSGVGAGCFQYLFPGYLKYYPEVYQHGTLFWQHAHCDLLEFPIECGVFGAGVLLATTGWSIFTVFRNHAWSNPIVTPLFLGMLQTLMHASFDFPFQCPAILVTWCAMGTLAVKWSELRGTRTLECN